MPINDNGDIVRAVGYVAIYGAYLEDRIKKLIEMANGVLPLREDINRLSTNNQTKLLLKSLRDKFSNDSANEKDFEEIKGVLSTVENHLEDRHQVIHAKFISKSGGNKIIRRNSRTGIEEEITSKEIIVLANDLLELQQQINGLKYPMQRLIDALSGRLGVIMSAEKEIQEIVDSIIFSYANQYKSVSVFIEFN